jgi:hypothetical protein
VIRLHDSHLTGLEVMARWLTEEGVLKDAFDFMLFAIWEKYIIEKTALFFYNDFRCLSCAKMSVI